MVGVFEEGWAPLDTLKQLQKEPLREDQEDQIPDAPEGDGNFAVLEGMLRP